MPQTLPQAYPALKCIFCSHDTSVNMQDMNILHDEVAALLQRNRGGQDDPFELAHDVISASLKHHNIPDRIRPTLEAELLLFMMSFFDSQEDLSTTAPKSRPWSVAWLRTKLDDCISDSSNVTVRQAAYCSLWVKLMSGMTDKGFRLFGRLLSKGGFLPTPNLMPRCVTCGVCTPFWLPLCYLGTRYACILCVMRLFGSACVPPDAIECTSTRLLTPLVLPCSLTSASIANQST